MNYLYIKGVQIFEMVPSISNKESNILSQNTSNTWQKDRGEEEKLSDTKQGKNAEDAFIKYLDEYKNFTYITYDKIRIDNYKKHAPFDGLLFKNNKTNPIIVAACIDKILKDVEDDTYGRLTVETRNTLRENDIYTVEIKSTKVNAKKKSGTYNESTQAYNYDYLINKIRYDDYFIYPHFCRNTPDITNYDEYKQYLIDNKKIILTKDCSFDEAIFQTEYYNSSDIQIRIYVDFDKNEYFLIGYILIEDIILNKNIKKFPSTKSQDALYYTTKLSNGKSLNLLFSDPKLWDINTYKVFKLCNEYRNKK